MNGWPDGDFVEFSRIRAGKVEIAMTVGTGEDRNDLQCSEAAISAPVDVLLQQDPFGSDYIFMPGILSVSWSLGMEEGVEVGFGGRDEVSGPA